MPAARFIRRAARTAAVWSDTTADREPADSFRLGGLVARASASNPTPATASGATPPPRSIVATGW